MSERLTQITLVEKDILDLLPGEMTCDTKRQYWFIGCPLCTEPGGLAHGSVHPVHTVTEQDGFVTISPSIRCKCGAHYFIEHNQIKWV
jgi:hypothetical protein